MTDSMAPVPDPYEHMPARQETAGPSVDAIPVTIVTPEEHEAPEFASFTTYSVPASGSFPQQILPQNDRRAKARILVFAGTGAAATAFVRVGTRGQVMNNQGGQLIAGVNCEVTATQEQWMGGDGTNAMIVVVLDERYA